MGLHVLLTSIVTVSNIITMDLVIWDHFNNLLIAIWQRTMTSATKIQEFLNIVMGVQEKIFINQKGFYLPDEHFYGDALIHE